MFLLLQISHRSKRVNFMANTGVFLKGKLGKKRVIRIDRYFNIKLNRKGSC